MRAVALPPWLGQGPWSSSKGTCIHEVHPDSSRTRTLTTEPSAGGRSQERPTSPKGSVSMTELCEAVGWSTPDIPRPPAIAMLSRSSVCTRGHRPRTRARPTCHRQHDHRTEDQSQDNSYTGAHSTTTFRLSSGQTTDPGCQTNPPRSVHAPPIRRTTVCISDAFGGQRGFDAKSAV